MPQDAFTLKRVVAELNAAIGQSKINKIVQPDKDEVLLYLYTNPGSVKLILSTNASAARLSLTDDDYPVPQVAPNFCMLLRKHLTGAQILSFEQLGFERVIAIHLHCVSDFSECNRILYCEIMGKYSNLILVENGIILGALKSTSLEENCKRVLFAGAAYSLPAPQDKANPLDTEALNALFQTAPEGDLAEFLFTHISGIALPTAERIVAEYDKTTPFPAFVQEFLLHHPVFPCVKVINGEPKDFFACNVPDCIPYPSLSLAQDALYSYKRRAKAFADKKRKLASVIKNHRKKEEKRLGLILERRRACDNMEENRIKGELLTANLYRLQRGMRSCTLPNYYDADCAPLAISLDETMTPAQNAQAYYKRYNKQKRTIAALEPQEREARADLDYTESVQCAIERAEELTDLVEIEEELLALGLLHLQTKKKRVPPVTPFRTFELEGFRILAGRNNLQNDRLLKSAQGEDLWLHTQKYHSSHVVIVTEGRAVPERVLEGAAKICAYYSDGGAGNKIPVDYCKRKYVKKPPKSKAGFVIYTDYQTILVDPELPLSSNAAL